MTAALEIRGLRKAYGDVQALDGVDLVVGRGELVGFLGPNGAGKTTTMRSIIGLTSVDEGSVSWNGAPISIDDRRQIGYMPQERGLYARMRVHEHIAYIGRLCGLTRAVADTRAHEWAERVGLEERKDDLVQELSTGNQQRVQLAVALVHEPELLILDEPFAGLDPVAVSMLVNVMKDQVARGVSVVFSSHQLELVQDLTEQVTIIAKGSTRASGRVTELRQQSPYRLLALRWNGQAPEWAPPGADPVEAPAGESRFRVPANTDPANLIASAAANGSLASVAFEPPGLEDVFIELVSQ